MTEGRKLAVLLLHLELNPEELDRYKKEPEYARNELRHFGLSEETIQIVMDGDLDKFGMLFATVRVHVAFGGAVPKPKQTKK